LRRRLVFGVGKRVFLHRGQWPPGPAVVSLERVRHRVHAGVPVLHVVSSRIRHTDVAVAG
jgi:hypothetical protein